jgi:phosphoenolpyruvate-protein phosphotransferase
VVTRPVLHKGVALSPGIGRGLAFVAGRVAVAPGRRPAGDAQHEIQRFRAACERADASLHRLRNELTGPVAAAAQGVLGAQQLMLRDPGFVKLVEANIRQRNRTAEDACLDAVGELAAALESVADPYLRERGGDIRDIGQRVLAELGGGELEREIPAGSIVVTRQLSPSFVARLRPERVRAVVSESGAWSSHAAILLRSAGIPTVGGIRDAWSAIEPGSPLLVDGIAGLVFVAPSPAVENEYARLEAELREHDELLAGETGLPAVTRDGVAIHLAANLGKAADAEAALRWGADSVGLYRTEFAFGIRESFPTEDEQAAILGNVAERLHPRPIVFRLLDLGAEKCLPYFPLPSSANPALGLRGTRLLLTHPDVLRTQLRAILRVSAAHPVSVLLPMVGGLEEVRAVRQVLGEETRQLVAGGLGVSQRVPLGAMIEIPSAVLVARELAREADFLSLGSNDLAQYLLAADRDDPAMSGYYRLLHPAVLRAIRSVVRAAEQAGKELTICGEAAGDTTYTEVFLGLGLRRFSASPRQLGELRHQLRRCHAGRALSLARTLLRCATEDTVRRALDRTATGTP